MSLSRTTGKTENKKILYIVPGTGLDSEEVERRKRVLNSLTSSNFEIDVKTSRTGPPSIESYYDEYMSVPDTLRSVVEAEAQGYDALIIGCYGDPGLEPARELVDVPVVGPGGDYDALGLLLRGRVQHPHHTRQREEIDEEIRAEGRPCGETRLR